MKGLNTNVPLLRRLLLWMRVVVLWGHPWGLRLSILPIMSVL